MAQHPWFTKRELREELTEEEWAERLRRRKASKEAREKAEAEVEWEERKERRERPVRTVVGGVKKAVREVKERKFLAEIPEEEREGEKVSKLKVAGRVVGGLAGAGIKGAARATGRTAKRVALEAPGYALEKAPVVAEKGQIVAQKEMEGVARATTGVIRALTKIRGRMPRGIRHPDSLIKNKEFYFGSGMGAPISPIGRRIENPMELYFGRRGQGRMPEGTQTVLAAMQQGYEVEQLEPITGLNPNQIMRSIQYLKGKKLWREEWD